MHFPIWTLLAIGAIVLLGGAFVLIYWVMGRGGDDDHAA